MEHLFAQDKSTLLKMMSESESFFRLYDIQKRYYEELFTVTAQQSSGEINLSNEVKSDLAKVVDKYPNIFLAGITTQKQGEKVQKVPIKIFRTS